MSGCFGNIVVGDFEYETVGGDYNLVAGDLPAVLCGVFYVLNANLQHVRVIRRWRGEFGRTPPFDIGGDTLFVAYSAWAELTCFMTLGWEFPKHVYDLHTAYLAASNVLAPHDPDNPRKREHKRLPDACRAYGIEGWERIDKGTIAQDIGEGRWRNYGQSVVFDYCEEDVRNSVLLLIEQLHGRRGRPDLPPASVEHVLHWSNYSAKTVARIQARGMLIDTHLWNLVQENKGATIRSLVRRFDPSQGSENPIYSPEGEWSYERFEQYLAHAGVAAWPRLQSGQLDIDGDAFRLMYHVPGIEGLHALRDSLGVVVRAKLPIGRDGRNRPSLFPFCTATGRNAHAKSLYNAHAGMRSFMVFPSDVTGFYLDWRTQEVGILAAKSGDLRLINDYRSGDIYHALADLCGLTYGCDVKRWKTEHPDVRQRMKSLQLGINYGMGVPSLARGLNRHPLIASGIIELHKRRYSRAWQYRRDRVQAAMLDRRIETEFGWPLHISTSPNKRTLYNFPMQGNGAEMLRLAAWRLCEADIVPNMLIHDGILLETRDKAEIEQATSIMLEAGREVCNGLEIGVDIDQELKDGALPRQAPSREKDVGDDDGDAPGDRRFAEGAHPMTTFDLNKFRARRGLESGAASSKVHTPGAKGKDFVQFKYEWTLAGAGRLRNAPLAVLLALAHRSFKMHRNVVPLGNATLRSVGISPDAKVRALRSLEAAGMVSVDWQGGGKTPLVTLLWK